MSHIIFILDHSKFEDNNIQLLKYISKVQETLKNIDIDLEIKIITLDDFKYDENIIKMVSKFDITEFPVLLTEKRVYMGYKSILVIYDHNISEYDTYIRKKNKTSLIDKELVNDSKKVIDDSSSDENEFKDTNESDEDDMFKTDKTDMMDKYREMIDKRHVQKRPGSGREHSVITNTNKSEETNSGVENDTPSIDDDETNINIDPGNIDYNSDDDPQDNIIENAYWARMSTSC